MYYNSKCKDDKRNSVKTYKRYGMEAKDFQQFIVYKMHKRCYNRYMFDNHAEMQNAKDILWAHIFF